jgi:hypothetical protein
MNDNFEQRLQRQTFRTPPSGWRREILGAIPQPVAPWWREWLWPSPVAWGAMAVTWLVIVVLQLATPVPRGNGGSEVSAETFQQRQMFLAKLMETRS